MNSTDLRNAFRSDVRDEVAPYLWSDADVYRYAQAAQVQFCKLEGGISDATSAATSIAVVSGEEFAALHPSVLKVRHARRVSDGRELQVMNMEDMQLPEVTVSDYGQCVPGNIFTRTGELRGMVLGMAADKVRWFYIPEAADTVRLVVDRRPLVAVTGAGITLEIAEDHHEYLLLWMKYLAHMKQDAETFDKGRAEQFKQAFTDYCEQAKQDRGRREHKFRTVVYGGIG